MQGKHKPDALAQPQATGGCDGRCVSNASALLHMLGHSLLAFLHFSFLFVQNVHKTLCRSWPQFKKKTTARWNHSRPHIFYLICIYSYAKPQPKIVWVMSTHVLCPPLPREASEAIMQATRAFRRSFSTCSSTATIFTHVAVAFVGRLIDQCKARMDAQRRWRCTEEVPP